jgi:hypothetical protein
MVATDLRMCEYGRQARSYQFNVCVPDLGKLRVISPSPMCKGIELPELGIVVEKYTIRSIKLSLVCSFNLW